MRDTSYRPSVLHLVTVYIRSMILKFCFLYYKQRQNSSTFIENLLLEAISTLVSHCACILVRSCLDNKVIEPFKNYFQLIEHPIRTRNISKIICLPKIKLEYARKSFAFTGAKVYNMLPLEAREMQATDFALFLKKHFSWIALTLLF